MFLIDTKHFVITIGHNYNTIIGIEIHKLGNIYGLLIAVWFRQLSICIIL